MQCRPVINADLFSLVNVITLISYKNAKEDDDEESAVECCLVFVAVTSVAL